MMSTTDESILGLLLRAHGQCAAQAHGEEFIHKNISAKCQYETAMQCVENAIRQVTCAERSVARQDSKEREGK